MLTIILKGGVETQSLKTTELEDGAIFFDELVKILGR